MSSRDEWRITTAAIQLEMERISGLLQKVGVENQVLVSGPLKNQPSFTEPLSPEGRQVLQGLVTDMYEQFVGMVALYVAPVVLCGWVQFRVERTQRAASLGIWPQVIGSAIVAPLVAGFFAAGLWFGLLGGEM